MNLVEIFAVISNNLIPVLFSLLLVALVMRYVAFKAGKRDAYYFNTFAKSVEKQLESEDQSKNVDSIDTWLSSLLKKVESELPNRSVRNDAQACKKKTRTVLFYKEGGGAISQ